MREPLAPDIVDHVRREREAPQPTQCDYLHLIALRDGLQRTLASLDVADGPVLDLYCGSQPYQTIIPWRPLYGFDIDRHFGDPTVVGGLPLPFRDRTFSAIVCTQALYLVEDDRAVVREMRRVLTPGGYAIVTVPHIFRAETHADRRYDRADLGTLFDGWDALRIAGAGGPAAGAAYYVGRVVTGAGRRWPSVRRALPGFASAMNRLGGLLERVLNPVGERWPASFILVARRPTD